MADEVLTIGVGLDSKDAMAKIAQFERSVGKRLEDISRAVSDLGKASSNVNRKAAQGTADWADQLDDIKKYYQADIDKVNALADAISELDSKRSDADAAANKDLEDRIKLLQEEKDLVTKRLKSKTVKYDARGMRADAGKDIASSLRQGASSFFSKDFRGMLSGGAGAFKGLGKAFAGNAQAMIGKGSQLAESGGMGMKALGGSLKAIGSIGKSLGPLLETASKLGPILGMVGAGIAGIIKLAIDAQAQAKEFQKDILQSASTVEFLAQAGGNTTVAYEDLRDTLKSVRDAAYDFSFNDSWGISADTHKAVLNSINAEGVSLKRLQNEADMAGQDMKDFSQSLVSTGVAYSRAFGVPIQEISRMQGELMSDMGMQAQEVEGAFSQMAKSAEDAGISSNKFFNMIRGVSQDLSLYNVRMGSTVKMLGQLGKVMSPRTAAQFMQVASKGLKGMGRDEMLKLTLLAGTGKMKGLVSRDIKSKTDVLAKTLGASSSDVSGIMQGKGAAGLTELIDKLPAEMRGAATEMATSLQIQMTRSKKGVFGLSGAASDLDPVASLEAVESAITSLSGGKSIDLGAGDIDIEKLSEQLGISQDELNQRIQFKLGMNMERERMKKIAGDKEGGKTLSKEDQDRYAKMQEAGLTSVADINKAGYDQLFKALDEGAQKNLKEAGKVKDFAEQQTDLQQTITDRIKNLVDFVMNQIYNVISGIWDFLVNTWAGNDQQRLEAKVARTKDPELMRILQESGGTPEGFEAALKKSDKFRGFLESVGGLGAGSELDNQLADVAAQIEYLATSVSDDPLAAEEELERLRTKQAELQEQKKNVPQQVSSANATLDAAGKALGSRSYGGVVEAMQAGFSAAGVDPTFAASESATALQTGGKLSDIFSEKGMTPEQIQKFMGALPVDALTSVLSDAGKVSEQTQKNTADAAAATEQTNKVLTTPHTAYFKFSNDFTTGLYQKTLEDAFLSSLRTALLEYYMYSGLDRDEVAKTLSSGMSPTAFAKGVGSSVAKGTKQSDLLQSLGSEIAGAPEPENKQFGGTVSGIASNGLAIFRRPTGEGVTGIRPGERVVPAYSGGSGGGNASVNITLSPEAQRLIQAEVRYGIQDHNARKRVTG